MNILDTAIVFTKTCSRCGVDKQLSAFGRRGGDRKGLQGNCKGCCSKINREWHRTNRDRYRERFKRWESRNRKARKIYKRERYKKHGDHIRKLQNKLRKANARRYRAYSLKASYGLSIEAYEALVAKQNGMCDCCKQECKKLFVDHDHATGLISSLLCAKCNAGIGFFDEDQLKLAAAIEYLKKYQR